MASQRRQAPRVLPAPNINHAQLSSSSSSVVAPQPSLSIRNSPTWAAICFFIHAFKPALALKFTIDDLEDDLVNSTNNVVPLFLHRLLRILTLERKINTNNFATYLFRQLARRNPESHLLLINSELHETHDEQPEPQTEDEEPAKDELSDTQEKSEQAEQINEVQEDDPADDGESKEDQAPDSVTEDPARMHWNQLSLEDKLDLIQQLCQWQFWGIGRLRTMMKDEDEFLWRLEPIGKDAKKVLYWLIGERLWVQHPRPPPPSVPHKARSKSSSKQNSVQGRKSTKEKVGRSSRHATASGSSTPAQQSTSRTRTRQGKMAITPTTTPSTRTSTRKRSAPSNSVAESPTKRPRVAGTRVSTRLRGGKQEDVWQEIPEEWLVENETNDELNGKRDEDEESELTELPDDEEDPSASIAGSEPEQEAMNAQSDNDADEDEREEYDDALAPPGEDPNFIEWETVCMTLREWENFPFRFANSSSTNEKALYKVLIAVAEPIIAELHERERILQAAFAVQNRKRSSRIQMRESEQQAKAAEQHAKLRESGAIPAPRPVDRESRLMEREKRRLEREEAKLAKLSQELETPPAGTPAAANTENDSAPVDIMSNTPPPTTSQKRKKAGDKQKRNDGPPPDASNGDVWELDCEVCKKKGWNVDDGSEVTCCEKCGKWQHVQCHDLQDDHNGIPRRKWEQVDFMCKACLKKIEKAKAAAAKRRAAAAERKAAQAAAAAAGPAKPLPPAAMVPPRPGGSTMFWNPVTGTASPMPPAYLNGAYAPTIVPPTRYPHVPNPAALQHPSYHLAQTSLHTVPSTGHPLPYTPPTVYLPRQNWGQNPATPYVNGSMPTPMSTQGAPLTGQQHPPTLPIPVNPSLRSHPPLLGSNHMTAIPSLPRSSTSTQPISASAAAQRTVHTPTNFPITIVHPQPPDGRHPTTILQPSTSLSPPKLAPSTPLPAPGVMPPRTLALNLPHPHPHVSGIPGAAPANNLSLTNPIGQPAPSKTPIPAANTSTLLHTFTPPLPLPRVVPTLPAVSSPSPYLIDTLNSSPPKPVHLPVPANASPQPPIASSFPVALSTSNTPTPTPQSLNVTALPLPQNNFTPQQT